MPWLILELCVFGVVVGVRVPAIVKLEIPGPAGRRGPAILICPIPADLRPDLFVELAQRSVGLHPVPEPTTALYFTVMVFSTVGFGDVVAQTNNMRLLVTVQMLLNLAVLGLVIRLLTSAARRGLALRGSSPTSTTEAGSATDAWTRPCESIRVPAGRSSRQDTRPSRRQEVADPWVELGVTGCTT